MLGTMWLICPWKTLTSPKCMTESSWSPASSTQKTLMQTSKFWRRRSSRKAWCPWAPFYASHRKPMSFLIQCVCFYQPVMVPQRLGVQHQAVGKSLKFLKMPRSFKGTRFFISRTFARFLQVVKGRPRDTPMHSLSGNKVTLHLGSRPNGPFATSAVTIALRSYSCTWTTQNIWKASLSAQEFLIWARRLMAVNWQSFQTPCPVEGRPAPPEGTSANWTLPDFQWLSQTRNHLHFFRKTAILWAWRCRVGNMTSQIHFLSSLVNLVDGFIWIWQAKWFFSKACRFVRFLAPFCVKKGRMAVLDLWAGWFLHVY